MKDKKAIRQAYSARARQAARSIRAMHSTMEQGSDVLDLTDGDMAFLRVHVADLTQAFHEMNAYRNTLLTD